MIGRVLLRGFLCKKEKNTRVSYTNNHTKAQLANVKGVCVCVRERESARARARFVMVDAVKESILSLTEKGDLE